MKCIFPQKTRNYSNYSDSIFSKWDEIFQRKRPKSDVFAPYNAQATVHLYDAFWALLLPVTVNGRVSDIWRAYLSSKLFWALHRNVAFMEAYVVHDRVDHDITLRISRASRNCI